MPDPIMHVVVRLLNVFVWLAWPFLVWLVLAHPQWHALIGGLALLFGLRWWWLRQQKSPFSRAMSGLALLGAIMCLVSTTLRSQHLLLWYPVAVNLVLLLVFFASLFSAMPVAERLARIREPHLPPQAVRYTRRVTQIWCLFFIFNAGMATTTCLLGDLHLWTLWNGVVSYLLIGILMTGEWLVRQRVRRRA